MLYLDHVAQERIDSYLARLSVDLQDAPRDERDAFLARVRAEIELDLELDRSGGTDDDAVNAALLRQGDPATCAARLKAQIAPAVAAAPIAAEATGISLKPCRACKNEVALDAHMCPKCGAPFPARTTANVSGYEWKSKATIRGWPLVHVAFGRDKNGKLRVAKGVVAIGQFGIGAFTVAQFGIGAVFGLGQFVLAPIAIGQFAGGLVAIGQFGFGVLHGIGMIATDIFHGIRVIGGHR